MIWLTWRQFRLQAALVFGAVVVLAVVLLISGLHLVHVYDSYLSQCRAAHDSATAVDPVTSTDRSIQIAVAAIVLVMPALVGMFLGAPLVSRELENGTYRLGWTQSVTRERWLATKFAVVGVSTVVAVGLLSLMTTWWYSPIEHVNGDQFQAAIFGLRGIVPMGYAAFAFMFGATIGVLTRRTLASMATSLAGFVFVRLAVTYWVRPHLLPPAHTSMAITAGEVGIGISPNGQIGYGQPTPNIPNAWVYSSSLVNSSGQAPSQQWLQSACPHLATHVRVPMQVRSAPGGRPGVTSVHALGNSAFNQCATKVAAAFHEIVVYQPASRYWDFQGLETAVFVVLAGLLGALCFWWVRHRLA